ncbi:MAG: hypothetical protein QXR30_02045 [Candidatus Woesearchaeota archaeon]
MDWFDDVLLELEEIDRVYFNNHKDLKKELKHTELNIKVPKEDKVKVDKKLVLNKEKPKLNFNFDFLKIFSTSTPLAKALKVFVIFLILFLSMIGIFIVLIMFLKA